MDGYLKDKNMADNKKTLETHRVHYTRDLRDFCLLLLLIEDLNCKEDIVEQIWTNITFKSAMGLDFKKTSYNPYDNLTANIMANQNRYERYIDFDQMEYTPEIASAWIFMQMK